MKQAFMRTWAWPLVIGIATAVGLLSALLADGGWDWLSAMMLCVPIAVAGWRCTAWGAARPSQNGGGRP